MSLWQLVHEMDEIIHFDLFAFQQADILDILIYSINDSTVGDWVLTTARFIDSTYQNKWCAMEIRFNLVSPISLIFKKS